MSNEFNIPSKAGKPHERHYTCPRRGWKNVVEQLNKKYHVFVDVFDEAYYTVQKDLYQVIIHAQYNNKSFRNGQAVDWKEACFRLGDRTPTIEWTTLQLYWENTLGDRVAVIDCVRRAHCDYRERWFCVLTLPTQNDSLFGLDSPLMDANSKLEQALMFNQPHPNSQCGTLPKALGSLASWCVSNGRVKWFSTQTICDDESFDLSDAGLLEFMNEKLWHKFVTAIPNKF